MFRQTERWLHQHIFKVGWLISNSFQVTTVVYYIIFLPGIVLHEVARWLAAGVFNVRAKRSVEFPQPQEIGELRLNFIRLSQESGRVTHFLIRACPLTAGMLALWAIAIRIFHWQTLLDLAADGSLESLAAALTHFSQTPDLWLWLYLAFVIANTMLPTLSHRTGLREKAFALLLAPMTIFGLWRIAGAAMPEIAISVETLLASLGLIIGQITLINVSAALVLGTLEAAVERVTDRSATIREGKMITMSRREALQRKRNRSRNSRETPASQPKSRPAPSARSFYDLKLPIPGPPGREPVSRSAVEVVNLSAANIAPTRTMAEEAPLSGLESATAPIATQATAASNQRSDVSSIAPTAGVNAPFARPFVQQGSPGGRSEDTQTDDDAAEPFARPFVMSTRPRGAETNLSPSAPDAELDEQPAESAGQVIPAPNDSAASSRTRPAPKPSQRQKRDAPPDECVDGSELVYEDLDDA